MPMKRQFDRHIVAPPVVDARLAGKLEEVGYGG